MSNRFHILTVCTGNICRSPAAERMIASLVDDSVSVSSAGIAALSGYPIHPPMAELMQEAGLPVENFAARQATPRLLSHVDLILAMTADQRAWVVQLLPALVRKTFTLMEFARLVHFLDPSDPPLGASDGQRFLSVLANIPELRMRSQRLTQGEIDVPDPYGQDDDAYERAFTLIRDSAHSIHADMNLTSFSAAEPRIAATTVLQ